MAASYNLSTDNMKDLIECQICFERFTDVTGERTPRLLLCCSAIACASCLQILLSQKAPCFNCRTHLKYKYGLKALPLCRVVITLMEAIELCVYCNISKFSELCDRCHDRMCDKCSENHTEKCLQKDSLHEESSKLKKLRIRLIREIFRRKMFSNCQMVQEFLEKSSSMKEFNEWFSSNVMYEGQTEKQLMSTMIEQLLPKDAKMVDKAIAVRDKVRDNSTMTMTAQSSRRHTIASQTDIIATTDNSTATSHCYESNGDLSSTSWLISKLSSSPIWAEGVIFVNRRNMNTSKTILVANKLFQGNISVHEYSVGMHEIELVRKVEHFPGFTFKNMFTLVSSKRDLVTFLLALDISSGNEYNILRFETPFRVKSIEQPLSPHMQLIDCTINLTKSGFTYNVYQCFRNLNTSSCYIRLLKATKLWLLFPFGDPVYEDFGFEILRNPIQIQSGDDGALYILDENRLIGFKNMNCHFRLSLQPNCSGFACLEMANRSKLFCGLYAKEIIQFINFDVDKNGVISKKFEYTRNVGSNAEYDGERRISIVDNETFVTTRRSTLAPFYLVETFNIKRDFFGSEPTIQERIWLAVKRGLKIILMIFLLGFSWFLVEVEYNQNRHRYPRTTYDDVCIIYLIWFFLVIFITSIIL